MQELVKEVTLINHKNNICNFAWNYSLGGILKLTLSVLIHISPTIQHIAGHSSIHIRIQELMNLLHGNKFSPWEDFFVNSFSSVLTNYVSVHVCTGAG